MRILEIFSIGQGPTGPQTGLSVPWHFVSGDNLEISSIGQRLASWPSEWSICPMAFCLRWEFRNPLNQPRGFNFYRQYIFVHMWRLPLPIYSIAPRTVCHYYTERTIEPFLTRTRVNLNQTRTRNSILVPNQNHNLYLRRVGLVRLVARLLLVQW